jgi:hypothetical protein
MKSVTLLLGLVILLASIRGVAAANKTGDELLNECKTAVPPRFSELAMTTYRACR